jgi:hypothetical protein
MTTADDMRRFLAAQEPEQVKAMRLMIEEMYPNLKMVKLPKRALSGTKKTKKAKKLTGNVTRAAMRPLNSFMAFRAYHYPLFSSFQQKDISVFINRMWLGDYFKAKWTIIAKAYSIVRGRVGKENAPLPGFLALACPKIGILDPQDYFTRMGWCLPTIEKELARIFTPPQSDFEITTTLSAQDIVEFCEENGYAAGLNSKS